MTGAIPPGMLPQLPEAISENEAQPFFLIKIDVCSVREVFKRHAGRNLKWVNDVPERL